MRPFLSLLCLTFTFLAQAQQEELSVPGQNLFVNKIAPLQALAPWLNGRGITVSIKEFGFDTSDVDFHGRIVASPNASTNLTTHANAMASLVGGAGNSDLRGRGAAPACRLLSSSFVGLQPDPDYSTQKITVQNHSYGIDIQNWYGEGAAAYDQTTMENPILLHVFSAGNKGDSTSKSGIYANVPGYANLSGNFKMAKNVLLVGSVDSLGRVDPLSSRGPAYDGRTKPDLVAFGYEGTSGAAALVSGAAAVIQQTLLDYTDDLPFSNLVRAILINSADDIAAPGPDFESGFGNLNLQKAALIASAKNFSLSTIANGQTIFLPINIPDKLRQFKITLAWNDPTAPFYVSKALLHDLDFSLLDPLGKEHLPWVLNTFPDPDSLKQVAHRGRDSLNNVEQVTLDYPVPGLWQIRVAAPTDLAEDQDFALAWSWDTLQHFEWTYPFTNAPTPANREVILRWDTNIPDTVARLEWKPFLSPDWRLIQDSVALRPGWRRWILPDTFAEAQLRMVAGSQEFPSEIFLISKELRMKIGFNCPDSVMLFWNSASPIAHYQLYGLGDQTLEPIMILTDTFVVLQKSAFPAPRFAVATLTAEKDALGPRSPAPDISRQGVACYFSNFLAGLNDDAQVELDLQIGTTYALSRIFFEKKVGQSYIVLNEQAADKEHFKYVDEHPKNGANIYRARVMLDNGATLLGDPATVYFAGDKGWWVFPNPVSAEGYLNVVSTTDGEARFYLFDVLGKAVMETKLDDTRVEVPLMGLSEGIYFYKISNGSSFLGQGKLSVVR